MLPFGAPPVGLCACVDWTGQLITPILATCESILATCEWCGASHPIAPLSVSRLQCSPGCVQPPVAAPGCAVCVLREAAWHRSLPRRADVQLCALVSTCG
jgi:hypothetical protein